MASNPEQSSPPVITPAENDATDGFGAAFAERSSDPRGQEAKQDGEESPSDREPTPKAGSEEAPAQAAAGQTSGPADTADPWVGLTPEQRQRLRDLETERDKLQLSERSQRGRVGALTKKINALTTAAPAQSAPENQQGGGGT